MAYVTNYPYTQSVKAARLNDVTGELGTDPALPLTGQSSGVSFQASIGNAHRLRIACLTPFIPVRVYIENFRDHGGATNKGVKNFTVYGSNSYIAFAEEDATNMSNMTSLGSFLALEHSAGDAVQPQYFTLNNTEAYRYIIFIFQDNYGDPNYVGLRHIEFQYDDITDQPTENFLTSFPERFDVSTGFINHVNNGSVSSVFTDNPVLSGDHNTYGWQANVATDHKMTVKLDKPIIPSRIYFENQHLNGTYTSRGTKDFEIYGTNSADAFLNITFETLTDLTLIAEFRAQQHNSVNGSDPEYFHMEPGDTAYRYFVLRIFNDWGGGYTGIRHIQLQYEELSNQPIVPDDTKFYPQAYNDSVIKGTTRYNASYTWYMGCDPALPLTGAWINNSWLGSNASQKFNIDYGTAIVASKIYLENAHENGASTDSGIRHFIVYGTNSTTAFDNVDWTDTTDLVQLSETFYAGIHVLVDESDPQYHYFENDTAYRYYILIITSNQGGSYLGFRHIELWEQSWVYTPSKPFIFYSNVSPKDDVKRYGFSQQLRSDITLSGTDPSYIHDSKFYLLGGELIGTLSGVDSGDSMVVYLDTISGTNYTWYTETTTSGYIYTSPEYSFYVRYLCSGICNDNLGTVSGAGVRLYNKTTGELVSETTTAGNGIFSLETALNDKHYVIAIHPDIETNAVIFDDVQP